MPWSSVGRFPKEKGRGRRTGSPLRICAHSKGRGRCGRGGDEGGGEKNGGAAAMAMGGGGRRWKMVMTGGPHLSASV
jgi:hypothetical protein